MTSEQLTAYERLQTIPERARFLLEIGVVAKLDLDTEKLEPVYRACIGDVRLPITAVTERSAIARATDWLQGLANPETQLEAASA